MQWRVFSGVDGQSQCEPLSLSAEPVFTLALKAGEDMVLRREPMPGWHNPPRRQYTIVLEGVAEVGFGDGSKLRVDKGDVVLMEDMTGQGHTTTAVERPWLLATIGAPTS
ncbi:MAG: hypothetical protein K0U93_14265 [Gammaproteobacteria bacterium]|nr:hypothetical protein [Gammaproteobacteria bacterium]